jgi:hypothetical protein
MAGLPIMLAVEALFDIALLNCRPSAVAAALLYAERRQRGAVPFWPTMLAKMTGYEDLTSPELAVAVQSAQKLCRKVLYTQIYKAQAAGLAAGGAAAAAAAAAPAPAPAAAGAWGAPAGALPALALPALGGGAPLQAAPGGGDDASALLESLALSLSSLGLGGGDLSAAALGRALQ